MFLLAAGGLGAVSRPAPASGAPAGLCVATDPAAGLDTVTKDGATLCLGGRPWYLHGATVYSGYDDPVGRTDLARAAGLNSLRLVNFIDPPLQVKDAFDEGQWARLDRMVATSRAAGLKVILDLSDYRNLLYAAGINPYTTDWQPFIKFVATRRNTVTGILYSEDPTIALVSFAGEVEPINSPANHLGITTDQVTSFYRRTFSEWRAFDPVHLMSTGGLSQLDWPSGIDWRTIMTLPGSDVCTITIYGESTAETVPPQVSSLCRDAGRPWLTEEFGAPIGVGDPARSAWFGRIFDLQLTNQSSGEVFWNLGPQMVSPSYDVSPAEPDVWHRVQGHDQSGLVIP